MSEPKLWGMPKFFRAQIANTNPKSEYAAWEIETVVHWCDEHHDENCETMPSQDALDEHLEVHGGEVVYGLYGRMKPDSKDFALADHICDCKTYGRAVEIVQKLNGKEGQ